MLMRFCLFLISYGLVVISTTQLMIYLNYRSIGYDWRAVFSYMVASIDFMIWVFALFFLFMSVFYRGPLRFPFSSK